MLWQTYKVNIYKAHTSKDTVRNIQSSFLAWFCSDNHRSGQSVTRLTTQSGSGTGLYRSTLVSSAVYFCQCCIFIHLSQILHSLSNCQHYIAHTSVSLAGWYEGFWTYLDTCRKHIKTKYAELHIHIAKCDCVIQWLCIFHYAVFTCIKGNDFLSTTTPDCVYPCYTIQSISLHVAVQNTILKCSFYTFYNIIYTICFVYNIHTYIYTLCQAKISSINIL
jgi:hypothetical protein